MTMILKKQSLVLTKPQVPTVSGGRGAVAVDADGDEGEEMPAERLLYLLNLRLNDRW